MNNPIFRLIIGCVLAAPIVLFLVMLMGRLIFVEEIELDTEEQRVLTSIVPEVQQTETRTRQRARPQRLANADRPPPPPRTTTTKENIDLPTPSIQGVAPQRVDVGRMSNISIDPIAISDRDAQPIRPPVPTYPSRALDRGIEGSCEVRFDVDTRGKPYNISADCTNQIFVREAERAVQRVEFAPKIVRGQAAERRNVIYPLEFNIG